MQEQDYRAVTRHASGACTNVPLTQAAVRLTVEECLAAANLIGSTPEAEESGDDVATGIRVGLDLLHQLGDLIGVGAVGIGPTAPLVAVDGTEVAVFIGPFVPDADPILLEVGNVGVALQEPQELVDDAAQVQLFGGQNGKPFGEIEPHLMTEQAEGAGPCAVGTFLALVEELLQQVEILTHDPKVAGGPGRSAQCAWTVEMWQDYSFDQQDFIYALRSPLRASK